MYLLRRIVYAAIDFWLVSGVIGPAGGDYCVGSVVVGTGLLSGGGATFWKWAAGLFGQGSGFEL